MSEPLDFTELNRVVNFLNAELERGMGDSYGIDYPRSVQDFLSFYRVTDEQAAAQRAERPVPTDEALVERVARRLEPDAWGLLEHADATQRKQLRIGQTIARARAEIAIDEIRAALTGAPTVPEIPEWATVQITKSPQDSTWQARLRGVTKDPHFGTEQRHSIYGEGDSIQEALTAAIEATGDAQ